MKSCKECLFFCCGECRKATPVVFVEDVTPMRFDGPSTVKHTFFPEAVGPCGQGVKKSSRTLTRAIMVIAVVFCSFWMFLISSERQRIDAEFAKIMKERTEIIIKKNEDLKNEAAKKSEL